jgi:hypothetical protein
MKKITIILSFLFPAFLFAQENYHHAPEQVRSGFHRDFPAAGEARWSQSNGRWNASFNDQGPSANGEMIARYDGSGRHVDSHIRYDRNDVPAPVVERAQSRYAGGRNYRFTRIEGSDGNGFFQVKVSHRGRNRTAYMDEQGRDHSYNERY